MQVRLNMERVQPEAYKTLIALDIYAAASAIEPLRRDLINIRASQINGCAYCVDYHTRGARTRGESEYRIYLIGVWREAGDVFTEEERLLLEMTEEITLISHRGLSDELYDKSVALLGEERTAQALMVIIAINAWNRVGVGLNMHPKM